MRREVVAIMVVALGLACGCGENANEIGTEHDVPGVGGVAGRDGDSAVAGSMAGSAGSVGSAGDRSGTGGASDGTGGANQAGGPLGSGGVVEGVGGANATGGSADTCSRPVGSCTAPEVTVTELELGIQVTGYGEEIDSDPLPMAIAPMPSGGSRLAWLGTDEHVYIAELDCDDHLVGTPFSLPAVDLEDIHADDDGGVVLITRDATNGGPDNCGSGTLCYAASSPCRTMWMVRFNASGVVEWETQVTNLSDSLAGLQDGSRFIWWYQHQGRLAFDGSNYAAYFSTAVGSETDYGDGPCVDVLGADRMQVVAADGSPVSHPDALDLGCSQSWTARILWDERVGHFVMATGTDHGGCHVTQCLDYLSGPSLGTAECDGTVFNGDIVLAKTDGYWAAWSWQGTIHLSHFTYGQTPDQTIADAGSATHPHLVSYGPGMMLLSWESGASMAAQVRDAGTGAAIGDEFTIDVSDHSYQAFKAYSDGSAAYPAAGSSDTSINIARAMPCSS
jgi:hypothetical protein